MSFRTQVGLLVAVLVAVSAFVVGAAARYSAEQELIEEIDQFLVDRSATLAPPDGDGRFARGPLRELINPRLGDRQLTEADSLVQITDGDGTVLVKVEGAPELPPPSTFEGRYRIETVTVDGTEYRTITRPLDDELWLTVARDLSETNEATSGLTRRLWIGGLGITAAAGGLGWLLARRLTRPVARLTTAAEEVARTQDLDHPVRVEGAGEVGRLATAFNTMLGALGASRRQQQQLVQDAGHELRTPLTSLRTNVDLLGNPALSDDDRDRVLAGLRAETVELTTLVNELVALGSDRRRDEPFVDTDLADLAAAVAERARQRTGRDITVSGVASAPCVGQVQLLERAVTNLIDNAVKFAAEGPIVVEVAADGVQVLDDGPGIADDELDRVFDRFHRAEEWRGVPGSGLGLAIVEQVAESHGGSATARNRRDGGAAVGFTVAPAGPDA